jgi:hypothetical protein
MKILQLSIFVLCALVVALRCARTVCPHCVPTLCARTTGVDSIRLLPLLKIRDVIFGSLAPELEVFRADVR